MLESKLTKGKDYMYACPQLVRTEQGICCLNDGLGVSFGIDTLCKASVKQTGEGGSKDQRKWGLEGRRGKGRTDVLLLRGTSWPASWASGGKDQKGNLLIHPIRSIIRLLGTPLQNASFSVLQSSRPPTNATNTKGEDTHLGLTQAIRQLLQLGTQTQSMPRSASSPNTNAECIIRGIIVQGHTQIDADSVSNPSP